MEEINHMKQKKIDMKYILQLNIRGTYLETETAKFLKYTNRWDHSKYYDFVKKIKAAEIDGKPIFLDLNPQYFCAILDYLT